MTLEEKKKRLQDYDEELYQLGKQAERLKKYYERHPVKTEFGNMKRIKKALMLWAYIMALSLDFKKLQSQKTDG